VDFVVVLLDDFDVVLGNKFIKQAKVAVMPHLGEILIGDEKSPCFVRAVPLTKRELPRVSVLSSFM